MERCLFKHEILLCKLEGYDLIDFHYRNEKQSDEVAMRVRREGLNCSQFVRQDD